MLFFLFGEFVQNVSLFNYMLIFNLFNFSWEVSCSLLVRSFLFDNLIIQLFSIFQVNWSLSAL